MLYFDICPELDLTRGLNLKMLSTDKVRLDGSFQTHLAQLAKMPSFRDNGGGISLYDIFMPQDATSLLFLQR